MKILINANIYNYSVRLTRAWEAKERNKDKEKRERRGKTCPKSLGCIWLTISWFKCYFIVPVWVGTGLRLRISYHSTILHSFLENYLKQKHFQLDPESNLHLKPSLFACLGLLESQSFSRSAIRKVGFAVLGSLCLSHTIHFTGCGDGHTWDGSVSYYCTAFFWWLFSFSFFLTFMNPALYLSISKAYFRKIFRKIPR